jgi:membrane protease YdiL (CAAX protease family)
MPTESTSANQTERPRRFPWRVFWLLLFASLAGAAAATPLLLEEFHALVQAAPRPSIPLPLLVAVGIAQNAVLLGVLIGVGLLLARKLELGAPLLESWLYHEPPQVSASDALKPGVLAGIGVGIVLLVALLIAAPHLPGLPFVTAGRAAVWKRVGVCFYGGIVEEVISRLFLLTLLGWLGTKVFQKQKARMSPVTFWSANIIAAILFGLGHLPNAAMVMHITPTVVVLALALNGIAAIPFGYLYWKRGLESAMVAHFCADFVIYVVGVTFLRV